MSNLQQESFEYIPEMETFEGEQFEWGGEAEWGSEAESLSEYEVLSESEVAELAGELLEVTNEAELDRFLGNLISRAGRALGQVVRSPIGQAIGGYLKGAAKTALPLAGGALGGFFGGPLGAKIGSGLASAAGSALGLEAETMNAEDREFEGAKKFVSIASDAVKSTVGVPANVAAANAAAIAQSAVKTAVQKYAPGLLARAVGSPGGLSRVGRWVRKGKNIILVNAA